MQVYLHAAKSSGLRLVHAQAKQPTAVTHDHWSEPFIHAAALHIVAHPFAFFSLNFSDGAILRVLHVCKQRRDLIIASHHSPHNRLTDWASRYERWLRAMLIFTSGSLRQSAIVLARDTSDAIRVAGGAQASASAGRWRSCIHSRRHDSMVQKCNVC